MLIKVIIVIVIIALLAVMGLTIMLVVNPDFLSKSTSQNNAEREDTAKQENQSGELGDTKYFGPMVDFYDYAYGLGNNTYRALIECSSVNYNLMGETEQNMVEASYSCFLNSLTFPITIYIQTREFDKETMMANLQRNIGASVRKFPSIADYAEEYAKQMPYLTDYIGNTKVKKKFIIVPFDNTDLADVSALTQEEITEFALEELMIRASSVCSAIGGCGIDAHICNKEEIAECIYSYYHRDYYKIASEIINGEYTTLAVNGKPPVKDGIEQVLIEAQNRLKNLSASNSPSEAKYYSYIVATLEEFKNAAANHSLDDILDAAKDAEEKERMDDKFLKILESQGIHLEDAFGEDSQERPSNGSEKKQDNNPADRKKEREPKADEHFIIDEQAISDSLNTDKQTR